MVDWVKKQSILPDKTCYKQVSKLQSNGKAELDNASIVHLRDLGSVFIEFEFKSVEHHLLIHIDI
jgi:hypothetical protein